MKICDNCKARMVYDNLNEWWICQACGYCEGDKSEEGKQGYIK